MSDSRTDVPSVSNISTRRVQKLVRKIAKETLRKNYRKVYPKTKFQEKKSNIRPLEDDSGRFPPVYRDTKDDREKLLRFLKDVEDGMHMLFDNWDAYFYKFPELKNPYMKMWRETKHGNDRQNSFTLLRQALQECPIEELEQRGLTDASLETKLIECQLAKTSMFFEQEIHKELERKIKEKSKQDKFYKIVTRGRLGKQKMDTKKSGSAWIDVIQILLNSILEALGVKTPIKEVVDLVSLKFKS